MQNFDGGIFYELGLGKSWQKPICLLYGANVWRFKILANGVVSDFDE